VDFSSGSRVTLGLRPVFAPRAIASADAKPLTINGHRYASSYACFRMSMIFEWVRCCFEMVNAIGLAPALYLNVHDGSMLSSAKLSFTRAKKSFGWAIQ